MVYLIIVSVLIFGSVVAQDPDCDYRQTVQANEGYYINKNYRGGQTCRYVATCPSGYNCRLVCQLNMPSGTNCNIDGILISKSGDPTLTGADVYCGQSTFTAISTRTNISMGQFSSAYSSGGSYYCDLTAQPAPTQPPTACRCGERKKTRIVGGQETKPNEYTMMAGIKENATGSIHCGGVIISSRYIMTAAHCVASYRQRPSALYVILGAQNIEGSNTGVRYSISRFIIHENFNPNTYDYDIALIELKIEIQFSPTVQPVCLPFKYDTTDFANQTATALGWGTIFFGGPTSNSLQKVDLTVISNSRCRASAAVTDRQLCTNSTGKDACQYDSGGPIVYEDSNSGLLFAIGIISYGNICAGGQPGYNTRVTSLLRWVVNNANSRFCIKR